MTEPMIQPVTNAGWVQGGVSRKADASDLTDAPWAIVEPLWPAAKPGGRPRSVDLREGLNSSLYLTRSGCQWDM